MPRPDTSRFRELVEIVEFTETVNDNYECVVSDTPTVKNAEISGNLVPVAFCAEVKERTPSVALQEAFPTGGAEVEGYYVLMTNPRIPAPALASDPDNRIATNDLLRWRGRIYRVSGVVFLYNDDFMRLSIQKQE